jgi:hypothetical protein
VGPTLPPAVFQAWLRGPGVRRPLLPHVMGGLACLLISVVMALNGIDIIYFLKMPSLQSLPFVVTMNLELVLGFLVRCKYYTAFLFNQAAFNAMGMEVYCGGLLFEVKGSPRERTEHWNSSIQQWLKDCFYDNLKPRVGDSLALLLTFMVSAFWHGVYLAYYIGMLHWGAVQHLAKLVYRRRDLFAWLGGLQPALVWYLSLLMLHYTAGIIGMLTLDKALLYMHSHYYLGSMALLVGIPLFSALPSPKAKHT